MFITTTETTLLEPNMITTTTISSPPLNLSANSHSISNPTLSLLNKCKTMAEMRQIHTQMIKSGLVCDTFAISRLVAFCSLSGHPSGLDYAVSVFDRIQEPNKFIFYTLIKGLSESPTPFEAIKFYSQMLSTLGTFIASELSLPSLLKACGRAEAFKEGQQVHGQILKTYLLFDPFVSNSVLRMYLEVGKFELAKRMFDGMVCRDLIAWNSMIAGCFRAGEIGFARELFDEMPERDLFSWNTMIDGYVKCGECELAKDIFDKMCDKDVVTWTCMICGYVLNDRAMDALNLFWEMLGCGIQPDGAAIVSVLSAIAELGFVEEGKWVHTYISKNKIRLNSRVVRSALIDMYSKCGCIDYAYEVFKGIQHKRNTGDWNSMISGLALHGLGHKAIEVFRDMERMKVKPDEISFIGLLTACSHGGFVHEGQYYFELMQARYGIVPRIQHYGCMIDLYGRAGQFEEALSVIQDMPMEPDVLAWKSILSACVKHGDLKTGEHAALRALALAPKDSSSYVLLSNIYAKASRWDDVARVRSMMKDSRVRKVPGCSSILVNEKVHEFLVGEELDSRYRDIVAQKLEEMLCRLKSVGYEPDITQVLTDVEEEEKEHLLTLHSEKTALAFGLININKGSPIRIVNNLRVCCDCHSFIKLVSKIYDQQIILRDQNRFHHFKSGTCSCAEYW